MKKILFVLIAFLFIACGGNSSKDKTENTTGGIDPALEKRLAEYMKLNEELDFNRLMDYIYPKVFDLAPREDMVEAMEDFFKSEEIKVKLEDLKIDKVHPVFTVKDGSYAKIDYSMVVLFDMSSEGDSMEKKEQNDLIVKSMAEKYGEGNVGIDKETGMIRVRMGTPMIAIKDEIVKDWSFISYKKDDPFLDKILSKEVQDKLATYK
ncbi:MAG: hypothetical protein HOP10_00660 [Chitinophagaceae bacterium]|nr:hypothetical protein [Chitinophagaceae bacterium]